MASARNFQAFRQRAPRVESAAEHEARLCREREMLAEAQAELNAGLGLEGTDVEAWLDGLDSGDTPPPQPKRKTAHGM